MGIVLRPHQLKAVSEIELAWSQGHRNILDVLPTGAGKTILKAEIAKRELAKGGMVVIFAHRDVLLEQISKALCLMGLGHSLMVSSTTRKNIGDMQTVEFGKCFVNDVSRIIVASVDKFYRADLTYLAKHVTLWELDEAHHLLDDSKWHRCIDPLVNARGLGVTATPLRADKKGLGAEYDGLFHKLIVSATMDELIRAGMLSPYRVFTPPTKLDVSDLKVTKSGDYNNKKLAAKTDKSEITGDAVTHYQRIANGKQAICFCVNIAHSDHVAEQFRQAGIKAVSVSSETPAAQRNKLINDFKAGLIEILVNCDLFGEGFDVPAVEVVIMLRKTASYSLFKQQFGRALRVFEGKHYGILIDHVGNVEHFSHEYSLDYPHEDPVWTLEPPRKKKRGQLGEVVDKPRSTVCRKCAQRFIPTASNQYACTYCGHVPTPAEEEDELKKFRAKEADLVELKIDVLQDLLRRRDEVDQDVITFQNKVRKLPTIARNSAVANHKNRQNAQIILRDEIQKWCTKVWQVTGQSPQTIQDEFEIKFGVNILKAQSLSANDARELTIKVRSS